MGGDMNIMFDNLLNSTNEGYSFFYNDSYPDKVNFSTEENEEEWLLDVPIPGIREEGVVIKVINDKIYVSVPEGDFTGVVNFYKKFEFKLSPDMITTSIEKGVLKVKVQKPDNNEFYVDIK